MVREANAASRAASWGGLAAAEGMKSAIKRRTTAAAAIAQRTNRAAQTHLEGVAVGTRCSMCDMIPSFGAGRVAGVEARTEPDLIRLPGPNRCRWWQEAVRQRRPSIGWR